MPSWLVPVLKWGGIALAVVAAAGLIYVQLLMPAAEEAAETAAPVTLYWVLLLVGVVAAIVGIFVKESPPESEA
jgi:uncharacterized membrane protein